MEQTRRFDYKQCFQYIKAFTARDSCWYNCIWAIELWSISNTIRCFSSSCTSYLQWCHWGQRVLICFSVTGCLLLQPAILVFTAYLFPVSDWSTAWWITWFTCSCSELTNITGPAILDYHHFGCCALCSINLSSFLFIFSVCWCISVASWFRWVT